MNLNICASCAKECCYELDVLYQSYWNHYDQGNTKHLGCMIFYILRDILPCKRFLYMYFQKTLVDFNGYWWKEMVNLRTLNKITFNYLSFCLIRYIYHVGYPSDLLVFYLKSIVHLGLKISNEVCILSLWAWHLLSKQYSRCDFKHIFNSVLKLKRYWVGWSVARKLKSIIYDMIIKAVWNLATHRWPAYSYKWLS